MRFPTLNEMPTTQQMTDTFIGIDRNLRIPDGAMHDTQNLTTDYYPLLASRKPRTYVGMVEAPNGLIAKEHIAWVDERKLFYNGEDLTHTLREHGVTLSNGEKEMVSMGAYIIILPDKVYVNTANTEDCGYIEHIWQNEYPATASMCSASAENLTYTTSDTAPEEPEAGQYWLDTSGDRDVLKVRTDDQWTSVATTYVKIACPYISEGFRELDGVKLEGFENDDLNGVHIIQKAGDGYIVVVGLIPQSITLNAGSLKISRTMPQMDYIIEAGNRLWGCKYGTVDGKHLNEIYACKLGDFRNWNCFEGLASDSWAASVGTDGKWTGAVNHLGYPIFFKEECLHKIYISSAGAHQVVDTACRGIMEGCSRSWAIVGENLYYKSRDSVMRYDGSLPQDVGIPLGTERFSGAVGAGYRSKYYLSMRGETGHHLFVLDTAKGIWIREDELKAKYMARHGDSLYAMTADGELIDLAGSAEGEKEAHVDWKAETGLIGYTDPNQKYVSRFLMRLKLADGESARVDIMYNSDGIWHSCGNLVGSNLRTIPLPIIPVRCDHFQVRLTGTGDFRLFSIAKIYERGSDHTYG